MNMEILPRGIRNCNPGNLRLTRIQWQGQIVNGLESEFVTFSSSLMGLRALMKTLLTYYRKHQLDTVESIINRWAPPHENATDHYAGHVAHRLNVKRRDCLNLEDMQVLINLAKAIVVHENGWPSKDYPRYWYTQDLYKQAADLAVA